MTINRNLLYVIAAILLVFCVQKCRFDKQQSKDAEQASLLEAVTDSVRFYKDHFNRVTAEKKGMYATLATVEANNKLLSANQKELVSHIKSLPKQQQKSLVAASAVKQVIGVHVIDTSAVKTLYGKQWSYRSDSLNYDIEVAGDSLQVAVTIPNTIIQTHYFDKDDVLHITATNTNPLVKNTDVDSIVLPNNKKHRFVKALLFIGGIIIVVIVAN